MKYSYYFILSVFFITSFAVSAQSVPWQVKNAFNTKYPSAKNIKWKHEINDFRALFETEEIHFEASFSNNGDQQRYRKLLKEI